MASSRERIRSAVVFVAVIGLFLGLSGYEILRNLREVLFFERTTGTVTTYIAPDRNAEKELEAGRLEFTYVVNGTQYEGRYPPEYWFNMPRVPYPLLERGWDIGEQVDVYYAPSDPSQCTLSPRIEPFPFAVLTFVVPFVIWGVVTVRSGGPAAPARSAGGPAYLPSYFILSAIAAFAIMIAGRYGGPCTGVALGLVLPAVVIPGCVWLISDGRRLVRVRRNRRHIRDRIARSIPREARGSRGATPSISRQSRRRGHRDRTGRRNRAILALVAIVWCICTGAFLVPLVTAFAQTWRAERCFVETKGRVLESRLKKEEGRRHVDYRPIIIYQYEIDGSTFRNDRITFGTIRVSRSWDEAEAYRRRFPRDATLPVYYDPDDPQQAVLDTDATQEYAVPAFGMSAFAVVGVLLVVGVFFPSLAAPNERLQRVFSYAGPVYLSVHILSFTALTLVAKNWPGDNARRVWIGIGAVVVAVVAAVLWAWLTYRPPQNADDSRNS